jgi:esterase/lipase superfamily enzyme
MAPFASSNVTLVLALIELSPVLQSTLGEAWPEARDQLLLLAGRLHNDGDTRELSRGLDRLLDYLLKVSPDSIASRVREFIRSAVGVDESLSVRMPSEARKTGHPEQQTAGTVVLPIFYGTDRRIVDDPQNRYSAVRGNVTYGIARVSVPTDPLVRRVGELSSPSWWRFEFSPDPKKHVVLVDTQPLPRTNFVAAVRDALTSADQNDVLLFIHGYNVKFTDAARRAAQIAVDLKFPGRTLLYSWCSAGHPHKYTVDEATVEWSFPHFQAFLGLAIAESGARSLHIIAHSMGNRALMRALEHLDSSEMPSHAAALRQVVFAAPDVDVDTFSHIASAFHHQAERFTLYCSSRDLALKASHIFHGYPRAGDAGDGLVIINGVDTIDASLADTSLIGLRHSYFGTKRSILNDIFALIVHGHGPTNRFDLAPLSSPRGMHWLYRP